MERVRMHTIRVTLGAAAMALGLAAAGPAAALTDLLPFGLGGNGKDEGKHIDSLKPATAETYKAMMDQREAGLALARSSGYGILPPSPLTAYADRIMAAVVKASPVPDLHVRTVVTADLGMHAEAKPDGIIYIGWELLKTLNEEDELAAVLAHELAHLLYRHHDADWLVRTQQTAAQAVGLIDHYKGALGKGTGDSTTGILISLGAEVTERVVATNLWNRDQEHEADLLGIDMMVRARYNPLSANGPLATLAAWQEKRRGEIETEAKARNDARGRVLEKSISEGRTGEAISGFFGAVISAAGEATDTVMKEIGGGKHPSTEERVTRIQGYIDRHYASATEVDTVPTPWKDPGHPAAVILAHYAAAWQAFGLIDSNPKEAESLLKKAVTGPTATDTFPRVAFAQLRQKGGKPRLFEINLERALDGKEPGFVIFRQLIGHRVAQGRIDDGVTLMHRASEQLGDPPHLIPFRIALMVENKKKAEAMALHAKCKVTYAALAAACDRGLKGLRVVADGDASGERGNATERILKHKAGEALKKTNNR